MAISTFGIELKIGDSAESLAKATPIKTFPELFGEPNLLDTTTLSDKMETKIFGVLKADNMQFEANYDKEVFTTLRAKEGKLQFFELDFGSNGAEGKFKWQGYLSMGISSGGVDDVVGMTINVARTTEITME